MVTTNISDYYSDISIVIFSKSFSPHNYIIINPNKLSDLTDSEIGRGGIFGESLLTQPPLHRDRPIYPLLVL